MKIEIIDCPPDGILLSIKDLYLDGYNDAFRIIKEIEKVM